MSEHNKHINSIKLPIRANKNFVYKGKKYPVDFSFVKKYSDYFYHNRNNFKNIDDIEIIPNNYEITDESIPMFVACCQSEPFDINDSNVFSLHQLSIQYGVPVLYNLTSKYINENNKQLIFQSISFKLHTHDSKVNFDLSMEEEQISSNFFEYINDDQLLSLPIPVLYRIINNEKMKINTMSPTNQNQYIEFLFKCLDKHKRKASVLFLNLDIENERIDILSQLLTHYSDTFDFNLINTKFLAKNTSFLLNEFQKLRIEFTQKLSEIESENKKQRDFFDLSQKSFNESKIDLENKVRNLEEKLIEQDKKLERYTSIKVTKIQINTEPQFLVIGSTMTLSAFVKPKFAFNDGVEWQIVQETENSVEVESKNEKTLVLKGLRPNKVTVIATALDGSGITDTKEIPFGSLSGTIEINVQQNQVIKGRIEITEEGIFTLDRSRSKYILNADSSSNLGINAYESGSVLDSLVKEVSFAKQRGSYYLHVLVVDNFGSSKELVSRELATNGAQLCYAYTGNVQSVELEPGNYKLEAWGAQGGSFSSTHRGGFGGYSTGNINLQSRTTLYVVVGKSTNSVSGGYNGGGSGGVYSCSSYTWTSYGGGGASHIGLKSGELTAFSGDYASNLLIVASGGGGAVGTAYESYKSSCSPGGCGGGCTGGAGIYANNPSYSGNSTGGTQSSGGKNNSSWDECGSFGRGSSCVYRSGCWLGGGGGSGFYGGGSGGCSAPGAGGSGFINTAKLTDAFMSGYDVPSSSSPESKTLSTNNVSPDAVSNFAKQNDGYVKITPI